MLSSNCCCPPVKTLPVRGMVVNDNGETTRARRGGIGMANITTTNIAIAIMTAVAVG